MNNPQLVLQEIFNVVERNALLNGPDRDHLRAQATALNTWIVERITYVPVPEKNPDAPKKK